MKSPYSILLPGGVGVIIGLVVATCMGVRDSIFTRLSTYAPEYVGIQRGISTSYKKLGNAYLPFDAEAAHDAYQQSLFIDEPLASRYPDDAVAQANLAYSCGRLGTLAMSLNNYFEAESQFQRGVSILEVLSRVTKLTDQPVPWPLSADGPALTREERAAGPALFQYWLEIERKNLAICQEAQHAIGDLDFALGQAKERVPELLLIRGRALARLGRHVDAIAAAERLEALAPANGEQPFGAARIYALAAASFKPNKPEGAVSADDRAIRESYLAKAVELLGRAARERFFDDPENRTSIKMHRDLVPLRDRDDFKQLLAKIADPH